MNAPPDPSPRLYVLSLDELTQVYARFAHIDPMTAERSGFELDLMRAEWEAMGRPGRLRVHVEAAPA